MDSVERDRKRLIDKLARNGKLVNDEHRKDKHLIKDILKRRVELGIPS